MRKLVFEGSFLLDTVLVGSGVCQALSRRGTWEYGRSVVVGYLI